MAILIVILLLAAIPICFVMFREKNIRRFLNTHVKNRDKRFPIVRLIFGALILAVLATAPAGYTPILIQKQSTNVQHINNSKLSLSDKTKYLATYNNPHDWIRDQREAEAWQMLYDAARPKKTSVLGTIPYAFGDLLSRYRNAPRRFFTKVDKIIANNFLKDEARDIALRSVNNLEKLDAQADKNYQEFMTMEVGYPRIIQFVDSIGKFGFYFTNNGQPFSFLYYFFFALIMGLIPTVIAYKRELKNANTIYWWVFVSMCAPFGVIWFFVALIKALFGVDGGTKQHKPLKSKIRKVPFKSETAPSKGGRETF